MEFNLQQVMASVLTAEQNARFNELKAKDDNFETLSVEETAEFTSLKKIIADGKKNQHIIPMKENFNNIFPELSGHFSAEEAKDIIAKVIAKVSAEQLLSAVIKRNIVVMEDGKEVVKGQTAGFTTKELTKALSGSAPKGATNIVGEFKIADYKFSKEIAKELADKKIEVFTWDLNKRHGRGVEGKVVQAITGQGKGGVKALDEALAHATEDFKKWLEVFKVGEGPAKGKQIFENKRKFFALFGLNENRETPEQAAAKKAAPAKKTA